MKKLIVLILVFVMTFACKEDEAPVEMLSPGLFVHDEALNGDLGDDFNAPTVLPFVFGQNEVIAFQSQSDVDYFTFTVPENTELSQIILDEYQSSDDAGFIGIVRGSSFPNNAQSTGSGDLLGGLVYGLSNRGTNMINLIGALSGAEGFAGSLQAGTYSVWLNQTGDDSEVSLRFVITEK
ncbi:MAG: hypothetical protein ACON5F_14820 [Jejuia sp.]